MEEEKGVGSVFPFASFGGGCVTRDKDRDGDGLFFVYCMLMDVRRGWVLCGFYG